MEKLSVVFVMVGRNSCPNVEVNSKNCGCTYVTCERKGKCCECIRYHLGRRELPGCVFPPEVERNYDRSFEKFISVYTS